MPRDARRWATEILNDLSESGLVEFTHDVNLAAQAADLAELLAIPVDLDERAGWLDAWLLSNEAVLEVYAKPEALRQLLTISADEPDC